jgi:hypothetical protein
MLVNQMGPTIDALADGKETDVRHNRERSRATPSVDISRFEQVERGPRCPKKFWGDE